ncbi:MAG: murein biosynthesis integral membrane protein MurJ [Chloroflexi bacterium]|nr:murein biosynthesis integral membrane protein MurJ [Chloroflexota bacterium]
MGIARAALVIMLGNVISRLLGLVREQVIAGLFGASSYVDAFTAASRVPTIVYDLLIGGMISAALVPVFSDYAGKDREDDLWRLLSVVLNAAALVLSLAMLVIGFLAPQLMGLFAAGYDDEVRQLSVALVRFMLPATFFMGLSGILTAMLYARQSFALPAFCIALFNVSMIVAALVFYQYLGVDSLVVGMVAGTFLQAAVQFAGLRGRRLRLTLNWRDPGLGRIVRLYTPVALGLVVSAVGTAIDTNLASRTGEGNLAAMRYATTVTQFPLGLIASAVSFAVLPSLSRLSGTGAGCEEPAGSPYKATFSLGLKMILLAILPATAGLVALRQPLVQLIFQHGQFTATDTGTTALAFLAYSPGLPAAAVDQLLIFAFYARKNTVTPVLVGVMGVFVYLTVGLSLIGPLGMPGLALANSAQLISHALVMLVLLWRAVGGLGDLGIGVTAIKAAAASAIMGTLCYVLVSVSGFTPAASSTADAALSLAAIGSAGVVIYVLLLVALRTEEVTQVRRALASRIGTIGRKLDGEASARDAK